MKYFVSKCKNNIYLEDGEVVLAGVKYLIDQRIIRIVHDNQLYIFDVENCDKIFKVHYGRSEYYFLDMAKSKPFNTNFSYANKMLSISLSEELIITIDGSVILRECVSGLIYSHYEKIGDMCLIHFGGERNYVVGIKKTEVLFASYFDEYNEDGEDRYFMCRMYDSINHGRVFHVGREFESYLVYLDEQDMNVQSEFVSMVFLDCIMASNYKYANNLLAEDISQQDTKSLAEFFPTFDYYYPIDEDLFVLMKKNTLVGIFKFEINNQSISNIIEMK